MLAELSPCYVLRLRPDRAGVQLNGMRERHDYLGDVLGREIVRGDDSCKGIDGLWMSMAQQYGLKPLVRKA